MNKELKANIKTDLKANGIPPRAVSVSVRDCGYSTSIRIKINSPVISADTVKRILSHYEEIDRDERTGEILGGGNTFLFVEYASGVFDVAAQEFATTARGALNSKAAAVGKNRTR